MRSGTSARSEGLKVEESARCQQQLEAEEYKCVMEKHAIARVCAANGECRGDSRIDRGRDGDPIVLRLTANN